MLSRTLLRHTVKQKRLPLIFVTNSRLTDGSSSSNVSELFQEVKQFFTHLEPINNTNERPDTEVKTLFHFSKKDRSRNQKRRMHQHKEIKRKAFGGLLQWCQAHQNETPVALSPSTDVIAADHAALDWLKKNITSFSCGQCLVVCSLLCDIVVRADARQQGDEGTTSKGGAATTGGFFPEAYAVIALLVRQIESSESLETQTNFSLLLSAMYGLFRAGRTAFVEEHPTHTDLIRAPQMLWFALLNTLRTSLEVETGASKVGPNAEDEEESSAPHAELTVDQLLTFFLLFEPEKQRELLSVREQKRLFQSLFSSLLGHIKSQLLPESELRLRLEEQKDDQDGRAPQTQEAMSIGDCVTVMRNIAIGAAQVRLAVLQYMLCNLQSPHAISKEEHVLLPVLFGTIESIPVEQRLWLTDAVVHGLETTSVPATVLLLPFVKDPASLLAEKEDEFDHDIVAYISSEQAAVLLASVGNLVGERIRNTLLLKCLASYPALLHEYEAVFDIDQENVTTAVDSPPVEDDKDVGKDGDAGGVLETNDKSCVAVTENSIELTPTTLFLLSHFLYEKNGARVTEDSASLLMAGSIAGRLRWFDREAEDASLSLHVARASANASGSASRSFAFRRLQAFMDCVNTFALSDLREDGKEDLFFDVLVRPLFQVHTDATDVDDVLQLLVSVLTNGFLRKSENQKTLLERLFVFCGWQSAVSARRFFQYIAPVAITYKVYPKEALKMIAKLKSLDPPPSESAAVVDAAHTTESTVPTEIFSDTSAQRLCFHTQQLTRALQYILSTPDWSESADKAEKMRQTASLWLEDYFRKLAHQNATSPSSQNGNDNDYDHHINNNDDGNNSNGNTSNNSNNSASINATTGPLIPTEEDLEVLLSSALQVGCKFPSSAYSEIHQRVCASSHMNAQRPAAEAEEQLVGDGDDFASTSVLEPWYPKPAHFILLTRGEMSLPVQLSPPLLEQMLQSCPLSIFANVLSTFLLRMKREGPKDLKTDLHLCTVAFDTLLQRPERGDALQSGVISSTAMHTCQNALSHLSRMARYTRLFALCAETPGASVQREEAVEEEWAETAEGNDVATETPRGDGISPANASEPEQTPESGEKESKAEIHALQDAIGACETSLEKITDLLTSKDVKDVAMSHLEKMSKCFPHAAEALFARLEKQLMHFSQQELLCVAAVYHAGTDILLKHLTEHDVRLTVDVGQYLALAKKLPMPLSRVIVESHLPHLSFPWVVRVLSALAPRHTEVPVPLLTQMLSRVTSEAAQSTTDSDRNFLLVVLQNYLLFDDDVHQHTQRHRTFKQRQEEEEEDAEQGVRSGDSRAPRTLSDEEQEERKKLIRACCKAVLRVDRITTLDEFIAFLSAFPGSLQEMTQSSIVRQANEKILVKLLQKMPMTKSEVVQLLSALKRHEILFSSTTSATFKYYFNVATHWSDKPSRFTPALAASVHDDIHLALLVGESLNKERNALQQMAQALDVLQHFYEDLSAKVLMLSEFTQIFARGAASHNKPSSLQWSARSPLACTSSSEVFAVQRERLVDAYIEQLCVDILRGGKELQSVDFANYLQYMSRLKRWGIFVSNANDSVNEDRLAAFDELFYSHFGDADAHNRCVMLKAMITSPPLFARYESFVTEVIEKDIALLSHEDIEMVLSTVLKMTLPERVESLMDVIGTRLLPLLPQCRQSTLVRLLQCYAQFELNDDALVQRTVRLLEEQCVEGNRGLDVPQVFTLLIALDRLQLADPPEKLLTYCFGEIAKHVESLSLSYLAQGAQLALHLEMGYSACINAIVSKFLETRDLNHHGWMKDVADEICDAYAVELPPHLVMPKLRKRREKERRKEFWNVRKRLVALDEFGV